MKKEIRVIIYAFVAIFFISIAYKIFYSPKPQKIIEIASPDNTFTSAGETTLRPKSIPFEATTKPIVREPDNVPQKDIDRTYRIITKDSTGHKDTVSLVILKDKHQALVDNKNGEVQEFLEQEYLSPILAFGVFPKLGIDGNTQVISPLIGLSFLEIYGCVQLPIFILDLQGIGIGLDVNILNPISLGVIYHDDWNTKKSIRLTLSINL
jgi:hypothetical protein